MNDVISHLVRFEPVGIEMDVREGETVLDAAFRQGISVMHGCKEGQCASCKSKLIEGDIELLKYSTFALPESERDTDHILLCRTLAYSDITVELLNYDEDLLSRSIAVKEIPATLTRINTLTRDIRMLTLELAAPLRFWAGQYVDITIPGSGITRSFSMANAPGDHAAGGSTTLQFIIKIYPQGRFLRPAGRRAFARRRADGQRPLWNLLPSRGAAGTSAVDRRWLGHVAAVVHPAGPCRARRTPARALLLRRKDRAPISFICEEFAAFAAQLPDFRFIPALSHAEPGEGWTGETGFIHEVVARTLAGRGDGRRDRCLFLRAAADDRCCPAGPANGRRRAGADLFRQVYARHPVTSAVV